MQHSMAADSLGVRVSRHFPASGHGKGLHDSEGGQAKAAVSKWLKRTGGVVRTAAEVVQLCRDSITTPLRVQSSKPSRRESAAILRRFVYEVTPAEIDAEEKMSARSAPGSRSLLSWSDAGSTGTLMARDISCFCDYCRAVAAASPDETVPGSCANAVHVQSWAVKHVAPCAKRRHCSGPASEEEGEMEEGKGEPEAEDDLACEVCGSTAGGVTMLLCDGCDGGWHMECLDVPLEAVPEGDWFCDECEALGQEGGEEGAGEDGNGGASHGDGGTGGDADPGADGVLGSAWEGELEVDVEVDDEEEEVGYASDESWGGGVDD